MCIDVYIAQGSAFGLTYNEGMDDMHWPTQASDQKIWNW